MTKLQKRKKECDKKIKEWSKFLKEDYDWDWVFILKVLKYKLERTRKCFVASNMCESSLKNAKDIEKVEVLLNRVIEDDYMTELLKPFDEKYGEIVSWQNAEGFFEVQRQNQTSENKDQIWKEYKKLSYKAEKMKQKDLNDALKIISERLFYWWD